MTQQVDPMIVPMPDKWSEDPEIRVFIDYWLRWSYDMWVLVTSGTGSSTIENYVYEGSTEKSVVPESLELETEVEVLFLPVRSSDVEERLDELQNRIASLRSNDFQEQLDELKIDVLRRHHDTGENFDKRYAFMLS